MADGRSAGTHRLGAHALRGGSLPLPAGVAGDGPGNSRGPGGCAPPARLRPAGFPGDQGAVLGAGGRARTFIVDQLQFPLRLGKAHPDRIVSTNKKIRRFQ